MHRTLPIFYGALLLTAVNLLLRLISTSFQVYLASTVGAAGVGLLQLVLSVNALALTAGMAGIRTGAMYITAEELGQKRLCRIPRILSGCFFHALLTGAAVGFLFWLFAPQIAQRWLKAAEAAICLRIFASFLPISCLCGVMTGYFTAANRIATLTWVGISEQLFSMGVTVLLLLLIPVGDVSRSCAAVVLGSCCGSVLTFFLLLFLHLRQRISSGPRIPVLRRLCAITVPLALGEDLRGGISALENLMVPRRLALFSGTGNSLAVFGILTGMVFPVMMFPASILYSLAELLIPELARCKAVGSRTRIRYLVRKNLQLTLLYALICSSLLYLGSESICSWLFPGIPAAPKLRLFSLLVPMLYCDLITDAMTKGLGQQKFCVRYQILSNSLDVFLLYFLLPEYGVRGYFLSFALTHALNFLLSIRRLLRTTELHAAPDFPIYSLTASLAAGFSAGRFTGTIRPAIVFLGMFFCLLRLFGILSAEDLRWFQSLLKPKEKSPE